MAKRNLDKFINKSREAAAEGAVLLRNEKNTLPLDKNEVVSVFGRPMFDYYRSGTGPPPPLPPSHLFEAEQEPVGPGGV